MKAFEGVVLNYRNEIVATISLDKKLHRVDIANDYTCEKYYQESEDGRMLLNTIPLTPVNEQTYKISYSKKNMKKARLIEKRYELYSVRKIVAKYQDDFYCFC